MSGIPDMQIFDSFANVGYIRHANFQVLCRNLKKSVHSICRKNKFSEKSFLILPMSDISDINIQISFIDQWNDTRPESLIRIKA